MSRRTWKPRYNTAIRPRPSVAPTDAPKERASWQQPGSLDVDIWPSPGAALARRTIGQFPHLALTDLRVAREWVARWEAEPPERRNPAYGAMRDYRDALEVAIAPLTEFQWWNYWCNH